MNCLNSKQPSVLSPWLAGSTTAQQQAPSVWHRMGGAASLVISPLPPVKSLATGILQDCLQMEYQKDACFTLPNTSVLFTQPQSLLTACRNKIQCWEGSPAVLRFCPISLFQVYPFTSKSVEGEEFLLPHSAFGC